MIYVQEKITTVQKTCFWFYSFLLLLRPLSSLGYHEIRVLILRHRRSVYLHSKKCRLWRVVMSFFAPYNFASIIHVRPTQGINIFKREHPQVLDLNPKTSQTASQLLYPQRPTQSETHSLLRIPNPHPLSILPNSTDKPILQLAPVIPRLPCHNPQNQIIQ
jgi:hypothetical protein